MATEPVSAHCAFFLSPPPPPLPTNGIGRAAPGCAEDATDEESPLSLGLELDDVEVAADDNDDTTVDWSSEEALHTPKGPFCASLQWASAVNLKQARASAYRSVRQTC